MMSRHNRADGFERLPRTSHDVKMFDARTRSPSPAPGKFRPLGWIIRPLLRLPIRPARAVYSRIYHHGSSHLTLPQYFKWICTKIFWLILLSVFLTFVLWPSYSQPPSHYHDLRRKCQASNNPGRGNANNEKVYIAATLHDPGGVLVRGDWGQSISKLVDILGPQNVHLSIYENDADEAAETSLQEMARTTPCNSTMVSEHLSLDNITHVTTPAGERKPARLAFLAEVRNRALRALQSESAPLFDKLLFVNDVVFDPIDAANLLFSTNRQQSGLTQYQAACAVDFINAFKFYDRFATRDFEGYTPGIPFFPWFTDAGQGNSRQDVLKQKDAVRVRSCWGGMTAFEAKWFQNQIIKKSDDSGPEFAPLRFRYDPDPFWEASECCLIHADLAASYESSNPTAESGVYMNPYVRVAYDRSTLWWLRYTRRIERLYSPIHTILNHIVGMPEPNPRRSVRVGDEITEQTWRHEDFSTSTPGKTRGYYQQTKRIAEPGQFCGIRRLMVLIENPKKGQKNWENVRLPPVI